MKNQFWIIDTDTPGESQGEFSASGPYPSKASAEAHIVRDTRALWEDGCSCTQSDKTVPWCKPRHIVQVVRTVQPTITAKVKLEETES
jgi:hypothetical protein